ncbi:methionyl-tRNA formyltransferase [Candidatus Falkowbacteria bacterium CG10_big_fil_rev_8_21_14_0_10_37_18]|uniref:Methionyl-tRNA formyltransferase n=1 Tax=Candidatus Falkowbacteria bacterium CG10_big_fil_rev_8_21_14_0_10_37_18 TaxID=1974562 RepID=A0A2H0V805_9BACT|nr:MAG: methionyl-tRNA formyltransferase [Candidatus Falkowbacteria bacterium CG10_big_fil_rev_8_21_14_0_10_37_18]
MPIVPNKKIRLIFMGTPDFSLPGLQALINAPHLDIVGVFTQPDKPVGRKQIIMAPPVKVLATEHNIAIFQPQKIKTTTDVIKNLTPNIIVVIAYGQIIPPEILAIPKFGCVNVHASLLPRYRGAACLNAPILNGDKETGVTIMQMDAGLDTGPILRQSKIELKGQETLEELHDELSLLGASILVTTLDDFIAKKITAQSQDDSLATYIKTLKKTDGKIDLNKPAQEIERMIRAYNPWPGTHVLKDNKTIKIIAVANEIIKTQKNKIGKIFLHNGQLAIQCGQDALLILKLQLEGGKIMKAEDWLRGNKNAIGLILQ